ncbi:hypothetical protein TCDM_05107 [Trypanosoma cruzi Dm28c]|uniref:Uncharacterized protein n=1 Tax=Trypanosoma cruzi Dm28c TaxID=1416333 RepID=V5BJD4_TRYCR|nr:hypothetical protein TCDM_05107 [Trypanosoma cruzi Dm28c]PBJ71484.1 hypothetical protein BCY84_16828 [Trypanosoma cruzi cruzi]
MVRDYQGNMSRQYRPSVMQTANHGDNWGMQGRYSMPSRISRLHSMNMQTPYRGMNPMDYNAQAPYAAQGGMANLTSGGAYQAPMRGMPYGPPGQQPYSAEAKPAHIRRGHSVLLRQRAPQLMSFRYDNAPTGIYYRTGSFRGNVDSRPFGSFRSNGPSYMPSESLLQQTNSFQRMGSNLSGFGSGYGNSFFSYNRPNGASSSNILSQNGSAVNFNYSFSSQIPSMQYNNGADGLLQMPPEKTPVDMPPQKEEREPVFRRQNSMTLSRRDSMLNGFYEFGPVAQRAAPMGVPRNLEESRLSARPTAPPQWPKGTGLSTVPPPQQVASNGTRGGRPPDRTTQQNVKPSANTGELSRKGSEKRIGMYFKSVQPTQDGEYKKEGDLGTRGSTFNVDPPMTTRVRPILLLEKRGGNNVEVDGRTAILEKPGSDEMQKFETHEIVQLSFGDSNVFIESLDEVRDTFLMGCNVAVVMADSNCPAYKPSEWFSWKVIKQLLKDVFAKMRSRSELSFSVSLLEDDQVMDLLTEHPRHVTLTVAQSPLFGNVAHGVIYQVVEDASEFSDLLDLALSKALGREGEERGILLMSAILKQICTNTPHTKGDEEDILLSSLFVSCVGDGIIHYNRILDKNPAEPRAMFQFALGGPSTTAAVFSIVDQVSNASTVSQFLSTLHRLGEIKNYNLRIGSVRRFVKYTNETIPKMRRRIKEVEEGPGKEAVKQSLARLELMLSDAKAMLESPETAAPKMYIRQ